jgi:hypothetical protein
MSFWRTPAHSHRPISRADLEATITEVIRNVDPACEGFGGVIIGPKVPASPLDTNWEIIGIRFAGADRDSASKALSIVVEDLKRQYRLSNADLRTVPLDP